MKANTEWLDTIGAYARSVEDIALFRAALMAIPHRPIARLETPPRIAVCFTPHKDELQPEAIAAIEDAAKALAKAGARVREIDLPPPGKELREGQKRSRLSTARALRRTKRAASTVSSPRASRTTRSARRQARLRHVGRRAPARRAGRAAVDALFADIDVILTPPAKGEAPLDWSARAMPPSIFSGPISGCPA